MRVGVMKGAMVALLLGLAGPALAIEATDVSERVGAQEVGADLFVGLGALTGDAGERTITGGLLGVAASAWPNELLGVEASLEGQRLPIDDPRLLEDEQALYRWNGGLLAKAGPMLLEETLRPYLGAGFGLSYINPTDGAEVIYRNDWVGEVPLTAGAEYHFTKNIRAGLRATYRLLIGDEFAPNPDDLTQERAEGSLFNASVTLGGRF
jgi:opacity protein-like surface antigen